MSKDEIGQYSNTNHNPNLCPSCGYCPTCGRKNNSYNPNLPFYPAYPYWWQKVTCTSNAPGDKPEPTTDCEHK